MTSVPRTNCAIEVTMSVIEGRWKAVVLCKLMVKSEMRFNQLMREIEGISPRMLTKQLKELERDEMLTRRIYTEIPPRVEYSLTERGKSIMPVLTAMSEWGHANMLSAVIGIDDRDKNTD